MRPAPVAMALLLSLVPLSSVAGGTVQQLLDGYAAAGAGPFDAARGAALWQREGSATGASAGRRCSTCHGTDLSLPGRHQRTRKPIAPLSPAADPQRLSDAKKVEKWLLRNCKWTWGRACTAQEKGDLLNFIQHSGKNS